MIRLSFLNMNKNIYFAIPDNRKNDKLNNFLKEKKFNVIRGSENNVLKRYYFAAKKLKANHIVRLTSDCPLIDYKLVIKMMKIYHKNNFDYVHTDKSIAEGLDCEMFNFKSLEKAFINSKNIPEKEHVSLYFKNNINKFKIGQLFSKTDNSKIRFVVDEKRDLIVVKKIIDKFPEITKKYFPSEKIIKFLKKSKKIFLINSKIIRNEGLLKSYLNDKISLLFVSRANRFIGMGNVVRLINYSKFVDKNSFTNHFLLNLEKRGNTNNLLDLKSIDYLKITEKKYFSSFKKEVFNYIKKNNIKILILDLLTSSKESSKILKSLIDDLKKLFNIKVVVIGDYRTIVKADHVIIPQNIPHIEIINKFKKLGNITFGLKSFPFTGLNSKIRNSKNLKKNDVKKILIFVSGSDPMQISEKISHELKKKIYNNYLFKFIFNKNINLERYKNLKKTLKKNKNIELINYKKNLLSILSRWSDLNIVGEGTAAIESVFLFKKTIILKYFNNKYSDKLNLIMLKKSKCAKIVNTFNKNHINLIKNIKDYSYLKDRGKIIKFNQNLFDGYKNFNLNKILLRTMIN